MTRSLTDITKALVAGLMLAFVLFVAAGPGAQPTTSDASAVVMQQEKIGAHRQSGGLCHHQGPAKHHCQCAVRTITAVVDRGAKRKNLEVVAAFAGPILIVALGVERAGFSSDEPHLRLNFNAMYATTRRMHI